MMILVLFSCFASVTLAKPFIENIVVKCNPEIANFSATFGYNEAGELVLNQTIDYGYTFDNVMLFYTLAVGKDENDKNYERVLMKTSLSICKAMAGNSANFIVKTFMESLENGMRSGDSTCPFKKGRAVVTNMVISDKYVPKFLMGSSINVMFLGKFMGKIQNQKKFNHMYTMKIFAGIKKD